MATSHFRIGPGITCQLKDTPDKQGVEVTLTGVFRHGGMTHSEIESRLRKMLSDLDIDACPPPEDKTQKQV